MANSRLRRIVVVGGGTAGWMSAAALAKAAGTHNQSVVLVESDEIGIVGVGEATIPAIQQYNKLLDLDENQFVRETQATFKLGIEFNDWRHLGHQYFHQFGLIGADISGGVAFSHYWLRMLLSGAPIDPDILRFNAETEAARAGKFGRTPANDPNGLPAINYAFQFDASRFAAFLRRYAERRGVVREEGKIVAVHQDGETGYIESVQLEDGRRVEGDFFIDCSGFRGLLIEGALEAGYDDWGRWLPCNRAAAVPCERVEEPTPFTRSTAREAGWQWRIPLQHRTGNGYVFADAFIAEDKAAELLLERLDGKPLADPRVLRFVAGQRKSSWVKNCLAVGLSSGFLEPLESTSIHLIQASIAKFLDFYPGGELDQKVIDRFNHETRASYEAIRDFIIAHYKVTEREDTPFWKYCKHMSIPDSLAAKLELFRHRGSAMPDHFDLFREGSWFAVLYGQGITPRGYHPLADTMSEDELRLTVGKIRTAIQKRVAGLPSHQAFIDQHCRAEVPPAMAGTAVTR